MPHSSPSSRKYGDHNSIKKMNKPEACCGLGGTYCMAHMERSKAIQSRKISDAAATGADCIATVRPSCIMQLRDGIRRTEKPAMRARRIIELPADAP